jgi:uncharacterized membrane protein
MVTSRSPRPATLLSSLRWDGPTRDSRFGDVVIVLFLLAQAFDGILTYVGVTTFGVGIEANPVISALMLRFGEGTALVGAKITAAFLGIALHLREVHGAVAMLAGFYVALAVLPWTALLFL